MNLPESHKPYTDKYFLRTNEILKGEKLNPYVRAQVFVRKGPGKIYGIDEAVEIIDKYSDLAKHDGRVYALKEGSEYSSSETVMVIEAPIQSIVELETMYLGVIAAETSKRNDGSEIDLEKITDNMAKVVQAAKGRPVSYFGARHWRYDMDTAISKAAYDGGATSCSTDIGAAAFGQEGVGTIPHALENIMAWEYGYENAVVEATKAFDKHIDPSVPRIALIDYANNEVGDTQDTALALKDRLWGVRVDTCGENKMAMAIPETLGRDGYADRELEDKLRGIPYARGNGVTISGVYWVNKGLDHIDRSDVKVILTSGFGNLDKINAFTKAETRLDKKLFDGLGVGGVFPARYSTMDIVAVGDDYRNLKPMAKVGRFYKPSSRLERVI